MLIWQQLNEGIFIGTFLVFSVQGSWRTIHGSWAWLTYQMNSIGPFDFEWRCVCARGEFIKSMSTRARVCVAEKNLIKTHKTGRRFTSFFLGHRGKYPCAMNADRSTISNMKHEHNVERFVTKIKIRIKFVPQLNLLIVAKLPEPIK